VPGKFRIALAQCESVVGTEDFDPRPVNLARAARAVAEAAASGAQLVLLGEMFLTGYRTDEWNPRWAVRLDGPDETLGAVVAMAGSHNVHIMIGTATRSPTRPGVIHNTAVLANANGIVATYNKLHVARLTLPDGQEANEARWFSSGGEAPVWHTDFGLIGPQICYDSSFPELSRVQSLDGAEILLNITASAWGFEHVWEHNRFARAYENAAWYVACSIVGEQRGDKFFGRSAVIDPNGTTVAEGKHGEEDLVIADIDPEQSAIWRARMNPLRARRPEAYSAITRPNEDGISL